MAIFQNTAAFSKVFAGGVPSTLSLTPGGDFGSQQAGSQLTGQITASDGEIAGGKLVFSGNLDGFRLAEFNGAKVNYNLNDGDFLFYINPNTTIDFVLETVFTGNPFDSLSVEIVNIVDGLDIEEDPWDTSAETSEAPETSFAGGSVTLGSAVVPNLEVSAEVNIDLGDTIT